MEVAESMQTVPTRAARVGGVAKGIASSDARRNIVAYNTFFKKSRLSFHKPTPLPKGYNALLQIQIPLGYSDKLGRTLRITPEYSTLLEDVSGSQLDVRIGGISSNM